MRMFPDFHRVPIAWYEDSPHGVAEALSHHLPPGTCLDFGGGASSPPDTSQYYQTGVNQANQIQQQMYDQARSDLTPWRNAGTGAVNYLSKMLVPDASGNFTVDPTNALRATPGYNWQMDQGVAARDKGAAARGNVLSGAQQKGLTTFGQGLADTTYQNYLNNLFGLSGSGQTAATSTGQLGSNYANQVGQNYLTMANAQSQNALQQWVAENQARQSGYNTMGSLLGAGIGVASNIFGGPIKKAVGNIFDSWTS